MRWMNILLFLVATSLNIAYGKNEEINEVLPPSKPKINLDANLRRALLKALTELENEENLKENDKENNVEKASASAFSIFTQLSTTEQPPRTSTSMEKSVIIVQRSKGLQHKPITTFEPATKFDSEQFITSATNSFAVAEKTDKQQQGNKGFGNSKTNLITEDVKLTAKKKIETTTPIVTTSTEENEAKVEDLQFFSAPLVAAFTVNQDEAGIPRSVIPIYKNDQERLKTQKQAQEQKEERLKQERLKQQKIREEEERLKKEKEEEQLKAQEELQQKQKVLEEEILRLRKQQEQQQLLIRQQQLFHEQQLQYQKQRLEEQLRLRNNQPPFIPSPVVNSQNNIRISPFTPITPLAQPQTAVNKAQTVVSLHPSINLNQRQLPVNSQQLPVKEPVDFNAPIFRHPQPYKPFNFQQLPTTQTSTNFNTPQNFQSFGVNNQIGQNTQLVKSIQPFDVQHIQSHPQHQSQSFGFTSQSLQSFQPSFNVQPIQSFGGVQQPLTNNNLRIQPIKTFNNQAIDQIQITTSAPFVLPQHNRVFRHETGVANFGVNHLQQSFQQNRFTNNNFHRIQSPIIRHTHLNNLLYNSGISHGKQQEDLNIVSKVLSLQPYDFNFANSNINDYRIKKL